MKRSLGLILALIFVLTLAPLALHAQDVASVTGVITDASGAVITGADVVLVNTGTSANYHGSTNSVGSYTIVNVPPGPGYKLTITKNGFAPLTVTDISLNVATTRTQNAKLTAGSVSTTLEVSASQSEVTINTTDATIGNNFDVKLLNDLPIQVRDSPAALFTLQPGVAAGSITGARTDQTDVTVDGLDVNDISTGQTFLIVANAPVDSVEEFRGTVAGQLSSSGPGGGGQFQLVTKNGTNSFHGDLNEYHRDVSTVANFWFNNNSHVARAPYIRNQFGGQLGGPVKKDKLFFFFNFYDSRIVQSAPTLVTVPLDSYRNGNISYILANASNGSGPCSFTSRQNTTPQCIGTLTPAQATSLDPQHIGFSSVVKSFLNSRYPHANDLTAGDGINTGGFRFNAPKPDFETNYVGRADYNLSPTMKLFGRFTISREDGTEFAITLPSDPLSNPFYDRSYAYVVGHTWAIGANKVNSFYYGDTVEKFNFPATYAPSGSTVLTFGTYPTAGYVGGPYNEQETQKRRLPVPVVRDDFNWTKGSHSLGLGGTFKFIKTESQQILDFNFVGLGLGGDLFGLDPTVRPTTANGYITNPIRGGSTAPLLYDEAFTFALGRIASVGTNYNYSNSGTPLPNGTGHVRSYRHYETELYASDTWKVNKNLTFTYGLRYQLYSVPYEVTGAESIQNLSFDKYFAARTAQSASGISGDSTLPFFTFKLGGKANNAAPLFQPSYKDFAPRFAFVYNPSYFSKLVINGGAGILYDRSVINALNFIQDQSSPLFFNTVNTNFSDLASDPRVGTNFSFPANTAPVVTHPTYTPNVSGGTPIGLGAGSFNTIVDPNLKDPYSITFNAGIQQELPGNFVLKISYVGRLGRRLLAQADASQLIDFPDKASGQELSTAFGNITKQMRAGQATATAQPWFENQIGPGFTQLLYGSSLSGLILKGDFADFVQALASFGLLDSNVGMASQFAENTFTTNKGSSNYNGLLMTLNKNMSHGLQAQFNYTWSHSIDNTSLIANVSASGTGIGFICDVLHPRVCRGNSDFDETSVTNANFTYQLPVGRSRKFASTAPGWVDEIIGGWSVSGIPQWHSGVAFSAFTSAFVAGFANNAPAIFNGNRNAIQAHVHKNADGTVNLFKDLNAANAAFSGPVGLQIGSRNNLRGASAWGFDAGVAKTFPLVSDRLNMKFRGDAFNVFNHPTFGLPNLDITGGNNLAFGQITGTTGGPRVIQLALRLEF